MTAGSGPIAIAVTGAAIGVAEAVLAVAPPGNWNNPQQLGNLLEFAGFFTPPATAGSLVLKFRQGTTTAGTQVGPTITQPFAASAPGAAAIAAIDASAFGNLQQQGQYVLTAQYAAAAGGVMNSGVLTLETVAPVI